jgi:hypothetical protein
VNTRKGYWKIAKSPILHCALPDKSLTPPETNSDPAAGEYEAPRVPVEYNVFGRDPLREFCFIDRIYYILEAKI